MKDSDTRPRERPAGFDDPPSASTVRRILPAPGICLTPLHHRVALIGAVVIAGLMFITLNVVRNGHTNEVPTRNATREPSPRALTRVDGETRNLSAGSSWRRALLGAAPPVALKARRRRRSSPRGR